MKRRRSDIEQLVAAMPTLLELVTQHLSRSGQQWRSARGRVMVCCPFHQEKTPSFGLYAQDTRFHCFGCGCDGDVIDFVAKTHNMDNGQAIKYLMDTYLLGGQNRMPKAAPEEPPEPDLTWRREQVRQQFEMLAMRLATALQWQWTLRKHTRGRVDIDQDPFWDQLAVASRSVEDVVVEVIRFWDSRDLVDRQWFELMADECNYVCSMSELNMHRWRRRWTEGQPHNSGELEWLQFLQPAPADVVRMVRETLRGGLKAGEEAIP